MAEYTGEVLSVEEARRRVPAYDRDGLNYVLTTQEFFQGVRARLLRGGQKGNVSFAGEDIPPAFVVLSPGIVFVCSVKDGSRFCL